MSPRSILEILLLELVEKIVDEFCHQNRFTPCYKCFRIECMCRNTGYRIDPSMLRDLASLNRTCRLLNELTTARLYYHPTAASNLSPMLLIRTLLARPDLARLVRVLTARPLDYDVDLDDEDDYGEEDDEDDYDDEDDDHDGQDDEIEQRGDRAQHAAGEQPRDNKQQDNNQQHDDNEEADDNEHSDDAEQSDDDDEQSHDDEHRHHHDDDDWMFEEVFDYIVDKFIASASMRRLQPVPPEWMKANIRFAEHTFGLEVLTSLCRNVEAVEGSNWFVRRGDDDPFFLQDDSGAALLFHGEGFWVPGERDFPNLRILNLGHYDVDGGFHLEIFEGLLGCAASSLQALRLHRLAGCYGDRVATEMGRQPKTGHPRVARTGQLEKLTHLFLDFSVLDFRCLKNLISLCPNVEYFEHETAAEALEFGYDQYGPQEALDAMLGV